MKIYKITFLLLLIFIAFNSCNKKSHFYKKDKDSEFKYEYTFSFDHKDDTSRVKIDKKEATKSKIGGVVSNGDGDEMPYKFYIKPTKTTNKKVFETDWSGKFEFEIAAGKYEATVFSMVNDINIERLDFEFEIEENTELIFDIYLKMKPELTIYQINSKTPLSKRKIEEIKKCTKQNRSKEGGEPCWEKGKYTISIQI
ncbi:hypothetical protein V9L05_22845 (plasmid) [Bernardetia sp. Wsw4-3y2]|uniref:hypothetical protein n=1 Tax=Bernardetia sp. Wsw4-3y2 TaxID=3127471 RepID=UPI0030D062EA